MGEPSTYQECTIGMIPDSIPKARQDAKIERSQHRDQYFWTPNGQRTPSKHITTPHNHSRTQLHFERQQTLHQVAHKPRFASPPFKLAGPNASHSRALEYFVAFSRRRLPPDGCDFSQLGHAPILDMLASRRPYSADKTHTQKGPILEATRKGHQRTSQHLPTTVPADQARISQVKITSAIPRSPPPSCWDGAEQPPSSSVTTDH